MISDEVLMAYLDNELPADARRRIDAALLADANLHARLKRQEHVRQTLSAAFDPVVAEPLPERLSGAAMTAPVSIGWRVRDGLRRLLAGDGRLSGFVPQLAAAAMLLIGFLVGRSIAPGGSNSFDGDQVVAEGGLVRALEQRLANDTTSPGPSVGMSFRAKDGRVCRTFDMRAPRGNFAGIACRSAAGWTVATLTGAPPRSDSAYELAGSGMPDAVRAAAAAMMAGEAFDAEQELRARDGGWR